MAACRAIDLDGSLAASQGWLLGRAYAAGAMGGMHTGDKLSRLTDAERQECIDDFLTGLGDCFDGMAMNFPHVSNVITARA